MGEAMGEAAAAGFTAWEPLLASREDARRVNDLAQTHGLRLPPIFVTGNLHDPAVAAATEARFLQTVSKAAGSGCRQVMVSPSPLTGHVVTARHLRQSRAGVWDEVLWAGDLDCPALLTALVHLGAKPSVAVELALERAAASSMDARAAHQQSLDHARASLVPLLGAA